MMNVISARVKKDNETWWGCKKRVHAVWAGVRLDKWFYVVDVYRCFLNCFDVYVAFPDRFIFSLIFSSVVRGTLLTEWNFRCLFFVSLFCSAREQNERQFIVPLSSYFRFKKKYELVKYLLPEIRLTSLHEHWKTRGLHLYSPDAVLITDTRIGM